MDTRGSFMTFASRLAAIALAALVGWIVPASAQQPPPPNLPPPQRSPSPSTYGPDEIVTAGHRFFGTVSRGLASVVEKAVEPVGPAQRLHPRPGRRPAPSSAACATARARSTPATPATCASIWQGPSIGFDCRRRRRPHHDAGLQPARDRRDLPALRRRRRLGLYRRRLRHDGADRQQHRGGADPLRASGCGSASMSAT